MELPIFSRCFLSQVHKLLLQKDPQLARKHLDKKSVDHFLRHQGGKGGLLLMHNLSQWLFIIRRLNRRKSLDLNTRKQLQSFFSYQLYLREEAR